MKPANAKASVLASNKFILEYKRAPGDSLMLTALVRDIRLNHGAKYQIDVRNNYAGLWYNNPYLTPLQENAPGVSRLTMREVMGIGESQRGIHQHYVAEFHRNFTKQTGIPVPCKVPHGDLHLSAEEKRNPFISGRYWIVVPGGKTDMTNKIWPTERWQQVVFLLRRWGLRFVQEGATRALCRHPGLQGVLNVVGRTSIRDLIRNIYHAEGVICGVTFMMHVAAALEKPCVVIAGGREEPWWEAYCDDYGAFGSASAPVRVPHRFLHTVGQLPCCRQRGCWLRRTVKIDDKRSSYNQRLCRQPVPLGGRPVPACMTKILPEHVVEAVMSYYEDGTLPPVTG